MVFSSGRGAIHMEETGQALFDDGGKYHGFQIWLNMPAKYKFSDPTTAVFKEGHMASLSTDKYNVKIVLGELLGKRSEIETLSPAFYFHVTLQADARLDIPTDPTHNAFAYVIDGEVETNEHKALKTNQIALYQRGDSLVQLYSKQGAELLILGGQPLNEPVFSYGPFVMNSEEEIRRVINDYNAGRMGDPNQVN